MLRSVVKIPMLLTCSKATFCFGRRLVLQSCLLGRCQQQNTLIELSKYPENVFLFIIC